MRLTRITRVAVVLAAAQMLVAGALWWVLSDAQRPSGPLRQAPSLTATRRLAEVYANAAFRAIITSDYAGLNELLRRSTAWPEIAYVSVEDTQGKILAHTDPAKVGRVWNPKLAAEVRTATKLPYEEITAPLVDGGGGKNGARVGQLRLGYVMGGEAAAGARTGSRWPLSLVLAFAAITAIPIAFVAESVGGRRRVAEQRPTLRESSGIPEKVQRLAEQLREARAETQRVRAELAERTEDVLNARNERDQHLSEVEVLRNSIDHYVVELHKLRSDAALVEADLSPARTSALPADAPPSAPEPPTSTGQEIKQLQARLMAQIAQAFRSSLTNILGYSKLLMRGVDGELSQAQKANVGSILDAGTRLVALVNGLSEYLRVEAGVKEARPAVVDLGAVVNAVLADSDPRGRLVSAPPGEPVAVNVDPRHLEHILRALVTDAMSLDPEATGRLSATSADGRVLLELALTDFHLAPEEVRGVLDPFASSDVSRPLDEARLRLALARGLAEANGGQLSVGLRGPDEVVFELELHAAAPVAS
jgi:signal transduction histidine kinase